MSTYASTHVAETAQNAMSQNAMSQGARSPSDVAARAALFSASPAPAAPPSTPVLQAAWRACDSPLCAVAFWAGQNEALENQIADDETTHVDKSTTGDLLAICDESGTFRLRDVRDPAKEDAAAQRFLSSRRAQAKGAQVKNALCAALSPNHRLLAVGEKDGAIQVRKATEARREARRSQVTINAHQGGVKALAWSGNAPLLASSGANGIVCLWDLHNLERRQILSEGEHLITALAWSQDGHWLAAGDDGGTISVWNVRGVGNQALGVRNGVGNSEIRVADFRWTKTKHQFWISALCFSPNGHALASGGYDGTARVWSCDGGHELQLLEGHSGVAAAAFAPDNRTLCCGGSDGALKLWDSWTGNALHALPPLNRSIRALAFAPLTFASNHAASKEVEPEDDARAQTLAVATAREVQVWRW